MPIKPENRKLYPANWPAIRAAILDRAGNCCEDCGVPNGAYRIPSGEWTADAMQAETWAVVDALKVTRIVLTIAHVDHDPTNNDGMDSGGPALPAEQSNLRAWCQRCHLAHDAPLHARNAARTRRAGKAAGDLFDD